MNWRKTAAAQGVKVKRGDYVIVRTGQMERCQRPAAGTAIRAATLPASPSRRSNGSTVPRLAAIASDTWGCEVRPNEAEEGDHPALALDHHPDHGHHHGGNFPGRFELAADCAADKVYEFLFVAPAIPITGAVGSPVNPLAIK